MLTTWCQAAEHSICRHYRSSLKCRNLFPSSEKMVWLSIFICLPSYLSPLLQISFSLFVNTVFSLVIVNSIHPSGTSNLLYFTNCQTASVHNQQQFIRPRSGWEDLQIQSWILALSGMMSWATGRPFYLPLLFICTRIMSDLFLCRFYAMFLL